MVFIDKWSSVFGGHLFNLISDKFSKYGLYLQGGLSSEVVLNTGLTVLLSLRFDFYIGNKNIKTFAFVYFHFRIITKVIILVLFVLKLVQYDCRTMWL